MQKLRPYVLPGLFVFHLVVLCSVILAGPTESLQPKFKDTSPLEMLVFVTVCCTLGSQWILTGLWAGWGTHPWVLRVPSCAALATLIWISGSVVVQRVSEAASRQNEMERVLLTMFSGWFFLVTALLCFRCVPALRWQLTLRGTNAGSLSRRRAHRSLTRGILIVVAVWAGVLVLLKDSQPWPVWESQTLRITQWDSIEW